MRPQPEPGTTAPGVEKEALRRALRDLEAAEVRVQRHAERVYDETRSRLVSDLLPVLDNLDRTLRAGTVTSDGALLEGVKMTRHQLEQVLLRYGVERIDASGERFDPALHDAIATRPTANHVGQVVEQLDAGYRFSGRVLRAAKVIVGVAPHEA